MWFLIKGSVWFALGLVVLSYFSTRPADDAVTASPLEIADAFSAATQAYQYVSAICSEKPEVCEKGAETFVVLGHRAKEGARVAFELLDKQFADKKTETAVLADPDPTPFPPKQDEIAAREASPADRVLTGAIPLPQPKPAR